MGRRLSSYSEMGKSGASFLKSWKKDGVLKLVLHREPPWIRQIHNFREIGEDDRGNERVEWFPFVCWEDEDFHKARRFGDQTQEPKCPGCRLIDKVRSLLESKELDENVVLFAFADRKLVASDFVGEGKSRDSYQDDFTAKTEYIIPVIPLDSPKAVVLTNEKWSLGKALYSRIKKDCEIMGVDEGDPSNSPTAYTFEYDDQTQTYSVSRFDRAKISDEIRELWAGEAPDATSYVTGGDPKRFRDAIESSITKRLDKVLDLGEIFQHAQSYSGKGESKRDSKSESDSDERPVRRQTEERPVRSAKKDEDDRPARSPKNDEDDRPARSAKKSDDDDDRPARSAKKGDHEDDRPARAARSAKKGDHEDDRPARAARSAKKGDHEDDRPARSAKSEPEPEPKPEPKAKPEPESKAKSDDPEVVIYACGRCGADFPSNVAKCPSCGAEAEEPPPVEDDPKAVAAGKAGKKFPF